MSALPQGVYSAVKKDGTPYSRASITYRGKHISLGSYAAPEDAHRAYLEAATLTRRERPLSDYQKETHALSFEKWVCLK